MKTHIAMWSGPRNISTALMRSFENRMDCFVSDEPLYAYYLNETKSDHPLRNKIIKLGVQKVDYIKLLDVNKLIKPYKKNKKYRIFVAYYLRTTRLIDNI